MLKNNLIWYYLKTTVDANRACSIYGLDITALKVKIKGGSSIHLSSPILARFPNSIMKYSIDVTPYDIIHVIEMMFVHTM